MVFTHREVVHPRLRAYISITLLEVVIEEAKQFAVVVELRLRRATKGSDLPAAAVVPRPEDQSASVGRHREKTLDRSVRVRTVEPSAVVVDRRARCLDVAPVVVRAEEV